MIDIVTNWTQSCALAGIPEQEHPNGGITLGGFITPSSINPSNLTRSYSRSAYIDSLPPRSNLHILAQQTVTKLVFSDKPDSSGLYEATGVQFGSSASSVKSVKVNKEVLLSGGALGSPKVLLHSGVGPKDVLDAAGVPVKVELPGVGQRLQDHLVSEELYQTFSLYLYYYADRARNMGHHPRNSRQHPRLGHRLFQVLPVPLLHQRRRRIRQHLRALPRPRQRRRIPKGDPRRFGQQHPPAYTHPQLVRHRQGGV